MIRDVNVAKNAAIHPSKLMGGGAGFGAGDVFHVVHSAESGVVSWLQERIDSSHLFIYDSTYNLTAIQDALDVTVECRNDYVVVHPAVSDYDIDTTLTMSKKSVHLVCPGGLGNDVGATNAARIHMTADDKLIELTDSAIEVAGLYFKNYTLKTIMGLGTSTYACNVHNNNFLYTLTSTTCEPIVDSTHPSGTKDGGSWGTFERNWFANTAGGSSTIAVIMKIHGNCKNLRIKFNEFTLTDTITATIGIDQQAVGGTADFNTFRSETTDGTFGACINLHAKASAIGNRGACVTTTLVSGGTADVSFSDNRDALNGGEICVET